jgi:hypothetical protein
MKTILHLLLSILAVAAAATEPPLPDRPREPTNPAATVVSVRWYEYSEAQAAIIAHLRAELAAAKAALTTTTEPTAEPLTEAYALADTHTFGGAPATPQGKGLQLMAKSQGGKAYERVIYLQFSLDGLSQAPRRMRLYPHPATAGGTLTLWPVADDSWTEDTLTWDNQPARGPQPLGTVTLAAGDDTPLVVESDALAAYLAAEYAGDKTASLALTGAAEGTGVIRLHSREAEEAN